MKKVQLLGFVLVIIVLVAGALLLKRVQRDESEYANTTDTTVISAVPATGGDSGDGLEVERRPRMTEVAKEGLASGGSHQQLLHARLSELKMSPAVRTLIGLDEDKGDRDARRAALKKLTRTLTADDAEAISVFLDFRHEDNPELPSATLAGLKNDALVVLLNQEQVPDGLGSQLVSMFRDEAHGTRWRDYSLQYLSQCYESASLPGDATRSEITNAYAVALADNTQKFAGTALLAVERLSRAHPEFDRKTIGDKAVGIAQAGDTSQDARITALRVCAMMDRKEILPEARILARTGATVPLRLAAIATVGDLGETSDLAYIESLASSEDRRLKRISKTASVKLRERLDKAAGAAAEL